MLYHIVPPSSIPGKALLGIPIFPLSVATLEETISRSPFGRLETPIPVVAILSVLGTLEILEYILHRGEGYEELSRFEDQRPNK